MARFPNIRLQEQVPRPASVPRVPSLMIHHHDQNELFSPQPRRPCLLMLCPHKLSRNV